MNFRNKLVAVVGSTFLLASSITMGAAADPVASGNGNASVKITTTAADNYLTVGITGDEFGTSTYSLSDQTLQDAGTLKVTVDDTRGTAAGWNVKLSATDFTPKADTSSPNAKAFEITNLSLAAGEPTKATDVIQPAATTNGQTANGLSKVTSAPQSIWKSTNGNGDGKFNVELAGTLTIPGGTLVGDYTSEVTVSIDAAP